MAVKVSDVLLGVRSRLGDEDVTKLRYQTPEILDGVNSALSHLSEELLCFARTWLIPCIDGVGRYELPSDFLRPISANYNDALITEIESMESRMNAQHTVSCGQVLAYDMQTLHVFPAEGVKDKDKIALYYHYCETVSDEREVVGLPNVAKEALVYFVLHLMYQKPVSSKSLEKSNYYLELYERELVKLRSRVRKNQQSKHIRTAYQRV